MEKQSASHAITVKMNAAPQISLFGVDEAEAERQRITAHAIGVIESYMKHTEAAVNVCVHLYQCKELFKSSGEKGWEEFCKNNFHDLGLSQGHIRSCVNTGRTIVNYMVRVGSEGAHDIDLLRNMSMSAVQVLGTAPDEIQGNLIERIAQQIESKEGGRGVPTAKEVTAQLNEMRAELAETKGALTEKDAALARVANTLRDRESQLASQRATLDEVNAKLQQVMTQQVTVVDADPTSKALRDEIENLQHQRDDLIRNVDRAKNEFDRVKSDYETLNQKKVVLQDANDAMEELQAMMVKLRARWTEAYLTKVRGADIHKFAPIFPKVANDLRVLADMLDPTVV